MIARLMRWCVPDRALRSQFRYERMGNALWVLYDPKWQPPTIRGLFPIGWP